LGPDVAEQIADVCAEGLRAERYGKGYEYDQQGVFGSRGALFVPLKAFDQAAHLVILRKSGGNDRNCGLVATRRRNECSLVLRRLRERRVDVGELGPDLAEQIADACAKSLRAESDGERDEYDQNCVFGCGGPAFVAAKVLDQIGHALGPE
jgi:hypothetical protein